MRSSLSCHLEHAFRRVKDLKQALMAKQLFEILHPDPAAGIQNDRLTAGVVNAQ